VEETESEGYVIPLPTFTSNKPHTNSVHSPKNKAKAFGKKLLGRGS
jgi:hypothetical protein